MGNNCFWVPGKWYGLKILEISSNMNTTNIPCNQLTWGLGSQSCRPKSASSPHSNSTWVCRSLWWCRGVSWGRSVPIHRVFIIKIFICQKKKKHSQPYHGFLKEHANVMANTLPGLLKHELDLLCQFPSKQLLYDGNPVIQEWPPANETISTLLQPLLYKPFNDCVLTEETTKQQQKDKTRANTWAAYSLYLQFMYLLHVV